VTTSIDVVVLTWNDGPLLSTAVGSALASVDVDVHVVVVDNGSDPPAAVAEGCTLLRNDHNAGVARGRNQGVSAGTSPYVCLLDSDARLHPETLGRLIAPFATEPSVALAAPVFTGQAPEASAGRAPGFARKASRALGLTSLYQPTTRTPNQAWWDVDFTIGACQVFRRSAWEEVSGIDESYFYGPEDVDFCLRLRRRGYRIVQVANAPCDHPARRRNRAPLTIRGLRHAGAVTRYLIRRRLRSDP